MKEGKLHSKRFSPSAKSGICWGAVKPKDTEVSYCMCAVFAEGTQGAEPRAKPQAPSPVPGFGGGDVIAALCSPCENMQRSSNLVA